MKSAPYSIPHLLCVVALFLQTGCAAGAQKSATQGGSVVRSSIHGGTIAKFNFDDPHPWPEKAALSLNGGTATVTAAKVGTVDVVDSKESSGGLLLAAGHLDTKKGWSVGLVSGKLAVQSAETDAKKLTLSFSLSATSTQPIKVSVESFDRTRHRTGGVETHIFPAAPGFYQRYALDLSDMKPSGPGRFRPADPLVQFTFTAHADGASVPAPDYRLQLDNVNYASPAYYVSPQGSDKNDGRTEQAAFATPQKALDVAEPGDIVLLMDGTYQAGQVPVASFPRPGVPNAWIVLKNYPGQHPTLTSTGWNIVNISHGSKEQPSDAVALAYLEVRGLHVRGEGDVAKQKYPDAMDKSDSRTNSNGIAVDSRFSKNIFHDIRIADNLVEFCPGCGIGSIDADWVTVEGNTCRSNCWTTIYAPSGISVMGYPNFDAQDNVYKRLVRNNLCCHNQTYEKWASLGRYSDGNGIILDVNQGPDPNSKTAIHPVSKYIGRTLVQSNLSYDNGGSGIHAYRADRVDIVNNTAYLNSASVHLEYGQIFAGDADDVRIMDNILVAPVANVAAGEKPEPVNGNGRSTHVIYSHNLYFGGNIAPVMGEGDVIADPKFVKPSIDDAAADFHLSPGSPGRGTGVSVPFSPFLDLDRQPRRHASPTEGAYEK